MTTFFIQTIYAHKNHMPIFLTRISQYFSYTQTNVLISSLHLLVHGGKDKLKFLEVAIHNPPIVVDSLHQGTRFNNNMLQCIQEYSLESTVIDRKPTIAVKTAVWLCMRHGNYLDLSPIVCVCHMYEAIHCLDHCRI